MFPHHTFPYLPTNSLSAHSTDSSILLALQKQWERQERLDLERNKMEKTKGGKEKNERRKGTKKRRQKMN